jgi:hypothetical protein
LCRGFVGGSRQGLRSIGQSFQVAGPGLYQMRAGARRSGRPG